MQPSRTNRPRGLTYPSLHKAPPHELGAPSPDLERSLLFTRCSIAALSSSPGWWAGCSAKPQQVIAGRLPCPAGTLRTRATVEAREDGDGGVPRWYAAGSRPDRNEEMHPFQRSDVAGGYCVGDTPVPIPNTAVKPHCANGTAGLSGGRVRRRQLHLSKEPVSVLPRRALSFLGVVPTIPGRANRAHPAAADG